MKYIIFDIDGTLTNTTDVDDKCYTNAFEKTFGVDISNVVWDDIQDFTDWGITQELVQTTLNRNVNPAELNQLKRHLIQFLRSEQKNDPLQFLEIPGSRSFFSSSKNWQHTEVGIGTGAWEESAQIKLSAIDIRPNDVCFSNSSHHRSREDIMLDVIQQLYAKTMQAPEQIIYFGDGAWDYKTCQNLGVTFFGIDYKKTGKLRKLGAQIVFNDFTNLEEIIAKTNEVASSNYSKIMNLI